MHPCEPAPPNPDQVFDEHKGVLDALDPHGSSLTSGHFGVALTTMLCPSGVTVYGITHSGSVRFSQQRSLLRPPVTRRYYDEVAAELELGLGLRLRLGLRLGLGLGLGLALALALTLTLALALTLALTLTLLRRGRRGDGAAADIRRERAPTVTG